MYQRIDSLPRRKIRFHLGSESIHLLLIIRYLHWPRFEVCHHKKGSIHEVARSTLIDIIFKFYFKLIKLFYKTLSRPICIIKFFSTVLFFVFSIQKFIIFKEYHINCLGSGFLHAILPFLRTWSSS